MIHDGSEEIHQNHRRIHQWQGDEREIARRKTYQATRLAATIASGRELALLAVGRKRRKNCRRPDRNGMEWNAHATISQVSNYIGTRDLPFNAYLYLLKTNPLTHSLCLESLRRDNRSEARVQQLPCLLLSRSFLFVGVGASRTGSKCRVMFTRHFITYLTLPIPYTPCTTP